MSNSNFAALAGVNQHISELVASVGLDQPYIADLVLPTVPCTAPDVTYRKMGNDHLAALTGLDTLRSPGTMPNSVDLRFSTASVTLDAHMLGANLDVDELAAAAANGN